MTPRPKTTAMIGLGLIGGSLALSLKKRGFTDKVIGVDHQPEHRDLAQKLGLIEEAVTLPEALETAELIILAIPVDATRELLPYILDESRAGQVIMDMGSTKESICKAVEEHPQRERFVAMHPIAGTENTGPSAAFEGLFDEKIMILSQRNRSSSHSKATAETMCQCLNMEMTFMDDPREHDRHIAYVSHLSHISSFILGTTVLEKEKDEKNIFLMAGSGFESTVRLGKSSPDMWAPIFEDNADHVSDALGAYIEKLQEFKDMVDQKRTADTRRVMEEANDIRRVLEGIELKQRNTTPQSV